ncbi:hypothetical protein [Burkholderia plantarii]|nr:hypothetical protein [Burkholderia plantarii]
MSDEFLAVVGAFALIAIVIALICWSGMRAIKRVQDDNETHW